MLHNTVATHTIATTFILKQKEQLLGSYILEGRGWSLTWWEWFCLFYFRGSFSCVFSTNVKWFHY